MTTAQWAQMLADIDFWSFSSAKLNLWLLLEQLHQHSLQEQMKNGGASRDDLYLESLASYLSQGALSSSGTALKAELLRAVEPALHYKVYLTAPQAFFFFGKLRDS